MHYALQLEGWAADVAADVEGAAAASTARVPDVIVTSFVDSRLTELAPVVVLESPWELEELLFALTPVVRRLGLAAESRVLGDLVFDESTSEVWRDGERIVMTPLEFEMLRVLFEEQGAPVSIGGIVRRVAARGIRLPRELAEKLMPSMRRALNAGRKPLLHVGASGEWSLAAA